MQVNIVYEVTWMKNSVEMRKKNTSEKIGVAAIAKCLLVRACGVSVNERVWSRHAPYEKCRGITFVVTWCFINKIGMTKWEEKATAGEKKELVPSHAVISSPSICHTRRSGNPVGWSDILSSGWLCFPQVHPLQTSHTGTQHLATASGPFTFFWSLWVSENWTSRMQTRLDNTAMEKNKKKQKKQKQNTTNTKKKICTSCCVNAGFDFNWI